MSFILRKVIENVQSNQELGNQYQVIVREENYNDFGKAFEKVFGRTHVADDDSESNDYTKKCYAIIVCNDASELIPLYKNQSNYVMTESGKTFCNLTYK